MGRFRQPWTDELIEAATTPDVRDTAWHQFASHVQDLRDCPEYHWAEATLADIQASVEKTHVVTEGQARAVARIRAEERTPSRNYDAWGHGRRWR